MYTNINMVELLFVLVGLIAMFLDVVGRFYHSPSKADAGGC